MKNAIFTIVISACVLSQCKKSEHVSNTVSDENLVRSTEDADTSKNTAKGIFPSDTTSANPVRVNPGDSTAAIFIRIFYQEYLLGLENDFADSVRAKYCTPDLIKKLANMELDYDPFLNAQDFDDNLLKKLDIKRANDPQGYYVVSYMDDYNNENVYIVMSLAEHEEGYRISDLIIGPELGNEK
jgi:hypothetical protein